MYCPRCSQEQTSEAVRFCSRCGFRLGAVRALLADGGADEESAPAGTTPASPPPRQRDVNFGAGLMFVGSALMVPFLASRLPHNVAQIFAAMTLFGSLIFVIMFSQPVLRLLYGVFSGEEAGARPPSVKRGDLNCGAGLMFVCSLLALLCDVFFSSDVGAPAILLGIPFAFGLILIGGHQLLRYLRELLAERDPARPEVFVRPDNSTSFLSPPAQHAAALPAAQSVPVSAFGTPPADTAEMLESVSVTERTTNLLDNR